MYPLLWQIMESSLFMGRVLANAASEIETYLTSKSIEWNPFAVLTFSVRLHFKILSSIVVSYGLIYCGTSTLNDVRFWKNLKKPQN